MAKDKAADRANPRSSLIPDTKASRERGLSGPPTARQRKNVVVYVATGRMSPRTAWKALDL